MMLNVPVGVASGPRPMITSIERTAMGETAPLIGLTESYMAEGDEDYFA